MNRMTAEQMLFKAKEWKAILELKDYFDERISGDVYELFQK